MCVCTGHSKWARPMLWGDARGADGNSMREASTGDGAALLSVVASRLWGDTSAGRRAMRPDPVRCSGTSLDENRGLTKSAANARMCSQMDRHGKLHGMCKY